MALTHVYNAVKYSQQQVDLTDLKTQFAAAITILDTIINDPTITNAEAVAYLQQVATIQKRALKALARLVVA